MKKLLVIIGLLFSFVLMAQERTVNLNGSNNLLDLLEKKKVAWNGTASDRLIPTTRDTIDYYVIIKDYPKGPMHFYANITFDTIAGADTTVSVAVDYKKFNSQSYSSLIAAANTAVIGGEVQYVRTSLGVVSEFTGTSVVPAIDVPYTNPAAGTADTLEVPTYNVTETRLVNTALYYGYLRIRLIINGNDSVGTGIKVKRVELQFF